MDHPNIERRISVADDALHASVLVVDDETGVRDLVGRWLASGGYDVATAANADEALSQLGRHAPAVALCDIRMPGRDGLWLAQHIRQNAPDTAVIMATGVQDVGSAVTSLRQGVIDYLTKPFGRDRLRDSVLRGLEWHRAAIDSRRWRETLETEMGARQARLAEALSALRIDSDTALDGTLAMVTMSDQETYAHAYRVSAIAVSIGRAMHMAEGDLSALERAALMHDIGKLAVPDAVLRKPAPLTPEELALVRRHPEAGADLLRAVPYLASAAAIVRDVHERMDGQGYPHGVRAEHVALGARIIAVADAFDAMTRPRVFRDAIAPREAMLEVARCAGTQFDPNVVAVFQRVMQL